MHVDTHAGILLSVLLLLWAKASGAKVAASKTSLNVDAIMAIIRFGKVVKESS